MKMVEEFDLYDTMAILEDINLHALSICLIDLLSDVEWLRQYTGDSELSVYPNYGYRYSPDSTWSDEKKRMNNVFGMLECFREKEVIGRLQKLVDLRNKLDKSLSEGK